MSSLRYLAPNAVTVLGMICGLMSLVSAHEGRWPEAGYYVIWAVLLDNLDGPIARALKASSPFGAQMDSFADFLNFGVAPGYLVYLSLRDVEPTGFTEPTGHALLAIACTAWVLANVIRLARFNVTPETKGVLYGIPTTLAAGVLVIWFLALVKYSPRGSALAAPDFFDEPHLFGDWTFPVHAWSYFPAAMIAGAAMMVSNLPNPKIGGLRNKVILGLVLLGVLAGYVFNVLRMFPEALMILPTGWLVFFLVWGQVSPKAKGMRPPPLFPQDGDA
jgi:CDP-diacylglycerol--serine O-phosphatidyltransferase